MSDTASVAGVQAETIDIAGTPVAVRRRGTGRPLLFLHGAGFTGSWLRFHEALAEGADVIAPELPGMGGSPAQDHLEGFDDLVLHHDDLRAALGLERPFDLVGYSLGGWIAAEYAVTYPEKLRSLTLLVPAGLEPPSIDPFAVEPEQLLMTVFNDPTNVGEVLPSDPEDVDVAVRNYEEASTVAKLTWDHRYDRKLARRLRRVSCPTLVIGAEHDRFLGDQQADTYAQLVAGARLERIPGTGHALVVEQPDATAQVVRAFQERLA
jgi:pimeloyl-ACP methyl ester carboxylesterase